MTKRNKGRASSNTIEELIDLVDPTNEPEEAPDEAPLIWVHQFNEVSAKSFVQSLHKFEENKQVSTIIVYIDSFGGEIYSLLSMLEAMEICKKPIYTVCSGKAMSAGAILLSAGDKRFIGRYSTIMLHQAGNDLGEATVAELQSGTKELERLQDVIFGILAKNCGKTKQQIKNIINDHAGADVFLTAKQALEFGLIDHVGVPRFRKTVKWEVVE